MMLRLFWSIYCSEMTLIYPKSTYLGDHSVYLLHILAQSLFLYFWIILGGAVAIDLAWRCCMNKLVTLDNDKVIVNDKTKMNESASNDVNTSLISSDDELTHLKNPNSANQKIVIAGLIIENTFTSITDMVLVIIDEFVRSRQGDNGNGDVENAAANEQMMNSSNSKMGKFFKYLRIFLKWFVTNDWDSASRVKEIVLPSLYLSGLSDELIPPKQMSKLFAIAKNASVLPVMQTFKDGDHNSTWQRAGQRYWDDIVAFLATTSHTAEQCLN